MTPLRLYIQTLAVLQGVVYACAYLHVLYKAGRATEGTPAALQPRVSPESRNGVRRMAGCRRAHDGAAARHGLWS